MVQTWWQKLNANERMAATGAAVVFVLSLLGGGWIAIIGAGAVIVIYWLKYSPNQITWPAPIQLINLGIAGIIGLFAVIGLLFVLGIGSIGFGLVGLTGGFIGGVYAIAVVAAIAYAVGAGMMVLGTWREYQAMPKTAVPQSSTSSTPPPPPAPPSTPSTPPSVPPSTPPTEPPSA
jgi:predicted membrane metal-binding protein